MVKVVNYSRPSPNRKGATYVAIAGLDTHSPRVIGVYSVKRKRDLKDLPQGSEAFTVRQANHKFIFVKDLLSSQEQR